jgi:hypothetical protein
MRERDICSVWTLSEVGQVSLSSICMCPVLIPHPSIKLRTFARNSATGCWDVGLLSLSWYPQPQSYIPLHGPWKIRWLVGSDNRFVVAPTESSSQLCKSEVLFCNCPWWNQHGYRMADGDDWKNETSTGTKHRYTFALRKNRVLLSCVAHRAALACRQSLGGQESTPKFPLPFPVITPAN